MKEAFTSINSFSLFVNVSTRTVQRRISKYNKDNSTDHEKGVHDAIEDPDLQQYLLNEFEEPEPVYLKSEEGFHLLNSPLASQPIMTEEEHEKENVVEFDLTEKKDFPSGGAYLGPASGLEKEAVEMATSIILKKKNEELADLELEIQRLKKVKPEQLSTLQRKLSSDWLIVFVLLVILFADMIAFSIIGEHEFKGKIPFAKVVFAVLGLATGIGSVVTYNRIQEFKLSEIWKWTFGVLQFLVFNLTINENWFFAETVMTLMFVLVFIGVQRSIKK